VRCSETQPATGSWWGGMVRNPDSQTASEPNGAQRSWWLLAGISVASTLGLAAAVSPLLETRLDTPWPWAHTQRVLLLAFPVTVAAAIAYFAQQQRRAQQTQRAFFAAQECAAQRAERHSARLAALSSIGRIMGVETSLQAVFDAVVATSRDVFECELVTLMLLDRAAGELEVRAASGAEDPARRLGLRQRLGQGVAGAVAVKGEPMILGAQGPRGSDFPGWEPHLQVPQAAMVVPIQVRDELVGVLNVTSYTAGRTFDAQDLQALCIFAENVGACIRHAEQAEWMRQLIQAHNANNAAPAAAH